MAECAFTLRFDSTADALFQSARASILEQRGTFTGTPQQGKASLPTDVGTVFWDFSTQGQNLRIEVTNKPWLVSCATIQQQMAELVASVPKTPIDTVGEVVSQPVVQPAPGAPSAPPIAPPPFATPSPGPTMWLVGGALALFTFFWAARLRWR
jgi:hypothetical protein